MGHYSLLLFNSNQPMNKCYAHGLGQSIGVSRPIVKELGKGAAKVEGRVVSLKCEEEWRPYSSTIKACHFLDVECTSM